LLAAERRTQIAPGFSLSPAAAATLAESDGHNSQGNLPAFKTISFDVAQALATR